MHFTKKSNSEKRLDFVKRLKSNKLLRFPGAYNPLCAKLIEEIAKTEYTRTRIQLSEHIKKS